MTPVETATGRNLVTCARWCTTRRRAAGPDVRVDGVESTVVRGRVVTTRGVLEDGVVVVTGERVTFVGPADEYDGGDNPSASDAAGGGLPLRSDAIVLPGLVDVHNHGGGGASFASADPDELRRAARAHLASGTTSVVASTVTDRPEQMLAAVTAAADAVETNTVAAIHVEGPFLAPGRCGAQDPRHLLAPDVGLARELVAAGRGHMHAMTVAPELPGADELIGLLLDAGVVPAVGHTEAPADLVRRTLAHTRAALGRPGLVTHLFNAMPPLHHRAPGPVAGALAAAAAGDARVELVADGAHLDDETVRMVFALLGPERVVLVTDAMAAAGMADGTYRLGPQSVRVEAGVARLGDAADAPLAGGTSRLLDVVRRCVGAGIDITDAVTAATRSPARALGLDGPALVPGARADLVVTDANLRPLRVLRRGVRVS